MKSRLIVLVVVMVMILTMSACGAKKNTNEEAKGKETPTANEQTTSKESESSVEDKEKEPLISVGLVINGSDIDDKSFNQSSWEGLERLAKNENVAIEYIQSDSEADFVPNLSVYSESDIDLIIASGFTLRAAVAEVAPLYPDQKFLMVDSIIEEPNVVSATFSEEQGSYLMGIAAAMKAKEAGKDTVGFIGGIEFELIQRFQAGYEAGVSVVDPNIKVFTEYVGSFGDAQLAQTLAAKMYDKGAYAIYHAAGGSGNGLIKEAKDRRNNGEDVWVIGVDRDQYDDGIYNETDSVILTSMIKRVGVVTYDISERVLYGKFPGGTQVKFDLSNDGVGIPENNPNLSEEIIEAINNYKQKVIDGEIVVPSIPAGVE